MPKRGEVWQVDFGITAKVRPALVISVPYADEDRALIGVIPHTTATRGSQFEVVLPVRFLDEGAFLLQGLQALPPKIFSAVWVSSRLSSFRPSRTACCDGLEFPPTECRHNA